MKGLVTNIQRYSINDGPGIRTTVFLKGCNLNCAWCHNPETISPKQELLFYEQKCVNCLACIPLCKFQALEIIDEKRVYHREKCKACMKCTEACLFSAIEPAAKSLDADEVIKEVMKDFDYYKNSGGGMTLSGGEALVQKDFAVEILKKAKVNGISTALDTAGNLPWDFYKQALPYTDLVLLDIKVTDNATHEKYMGVGNQLILENGLKFSKEPVDIYVRIPVVKDVNDSKENMERTAEYLSQFNNLKKVELLSYHDFGSEKSKALSKEFTQFDPPENIEELAQYFHKLDVEVTFE